MSRARFVLGVLAILAVAWSLRPIGDAVAQAIQQVRVVNIAKVEESGAQVFKIFDTTMPPDSRFGASKDLIGFKTVRVAIYQTVGGSSTGASVQTNYNCGGPVQNRLGVDVQFGQGTEGGVTAGNNLIDLDEPPNLSNRAYIYVAEFPILRPQFSVDLCNHTSNATRVAVYLYAFRN